MVAHVKSPLVGMTPLLRENTTSASGHLETTARPLVVKGYKFFNSATGEHVVVRGIDYYPRPNGGDYNRNSVDFFTEDFRHVWERDIEYLAQLGVNAVRLYAVDPAENHDAFMCALRSAGIYAVIGLAANCEGCEITKDESPGCYPPALKRRGEAIAREFSKYPNTLGFSAGNEINHEGPLDVPEWNGPCQKKFLRDMRAYIDSCPSMRKVPVGLVTADTDRAENAMYYNCRSDPKDKFENAEWFGLNTYVFCNGNARNMSEAPGFQSLLSSFGGYNYSIPVLLTEFGCISDTFPDSGAYEHQRNFLQAEWLTTSPAVQDVFAGGFVFEYSIEKRNAQSESPYPFTLYGHQNFGIGYLAPQDCDDVKVMCEYRPMPAFYNLRDAYAGRRGANGTERRQMATPPLLMDDFEPAPARDSRSLCPDRFPPLASFRWEADGVANLRCPPPSAASFVCPSAGGRPVSPGAVQSSMRFYFGAGAVAMAAFVLFASMAMWGGRRRGDRGAALPPAEGWEQGKRAARGSIHQTDSSSSDEEEEGLLLLSARNGVGNYSAVKQEVL